MHNQISNTLQEINEEAYKTVETQSDSSTRPHACPCHLHPLRLPLRSHIPITRLSSTLQFPTGRDEAQCLPTSTVCLAVRRAKSMSDLQWFIKLEWTWSGSPYDAECQRHRLQNHLDGLLGILVTDCLDCINSLEKAQIYGGQDWISHQGILEIYKMKKASNLKPRKASFAVASDCGCLVTVSF